MLIGEIKDDGKIGKRDWFTSLKQICDDVMGDMRQTGSSLVESTQPEREPSVLEMECETKARRYKSGKIQVTYDGYNVVCDGLSPWGRCYYTHNICPFLNPKIMRS